MTRHEKTIISKVLVVVRYCMMLRCKNMFWAEFDVSNNCLHVEVMYGSGEFLNEWVFFDSPVVLRNLDGIIKKLIEAIKFDF